MDLIERLEAVDEDLAWLEHELFYFGAGVLPFYLDEQGVLREEPRPTTDVDTLVQLGSNANSGAAVRAIESSLQRHGWKVDIRPHRRNMYAYVSPRDVEVDLVFDGLCGD